VLSGDCSVVPGNAYFDPSDHYVVNTEAWIPFPAVVDPELPITERYRATLLVQPFDPNCFTPPPNESSATVSSTYRGDNHQGFGESYRLATEVSFDFNRWSNQITNFTNDSVRPAGTSYRDKVYNFHGNVIDTCTQSATATNTQAAQATSSTSFTVGYNGKNPLVQPSFLAPPIVASISGALAQDGSLTLTYNTTQFPSQGIQVSIDGQTVLTAIENDASCLPSQNVLGLAGAGTLYRGLTQYESSSVTAELGGSSSISDPSPLCTVG
jgi:hypothetical protein